MIFDWYGARRNFRQVLLAATLAIVCVLGSSAGAVQIHNSKRLDATEQAAVYAFEAALKRDWHPMKMLVRPNLEALCTADEFSDPNKSEWGMGFEDFERITYSDEAELDAKLRDLVSDWKAGRRPQRSPFYKVPFPNVHRFAIKRCEADGTTTIVLAVYLSSWDAWKQSIALLLGK
jgi:hypothetical protein